MAQHSLHEEQTLHVKHALHVDDTYMDKFVSTGIDMTMLYVYVRFCLLWDFLQHNMNL